MSSWKQPTAAQQADKWAELAIHPFSRVGFRGVRLIDSEGKDSNFISGILCIAESEDIEDRGQDFRFSGKIRFRKADDARWPDQFSVSTNTLFARLHS